MPFQFTGDFLVRRKPEEVYDFLVDPQRPVRALYSGKGSVAGGNVEMTAGFEVEAVSEGARVHWKGTAQIFGRLISIAGGILEPLAKKNVQKLIDGLQAALG